MTKCRRARRRTAVRGWALRSIVAALFAFGALVGRADADAPQPFRLCADPDNLPFSASRPETPGYYIELGRAIADQLSRPFEPVWEYTYFAKRAVRTSLLAGRCDGFIGLPDDPDFMGPKLIFSKPILAPGYALVLPHGTSIKTLSDFVGHRVAVQFASPPQSLLATRDDIQTVTALSPEEAMRDLDEGRADLAFIWGPSAGWINKTAGRSTYDIVPVSGPHMQWQAVIGFASGETALRAQVNAAINALSGQADALMIKYGFPKGTPVQLTGDREAAPHPAPTGDNSASPASGQTAAAPTPSPVAAPSLDAKAVDAGHELFNENCSHCHGPDAVEGERRRNLRLLHHRYGDNLDQVFMTTVTHGRVEKGMPNWSGILTTDQFKKILAYLHSIQEPE